MGDLQNKFKSIMEDMENKVENKEDLEYIKTQVYNISLLFLDELDKIAGNNIDKMNSVLEKQKELTEKMEKIEKIVNHIEKDIYLDDSYDFEIVCPYCNYEFSIEIGNELRKEVTCPECHNAIELSWNEEEEGCSGHCSCCDGDCGSEEESDFEADDEDDM